MVASLGLLEMRKASFLSAGLEARDFFAGLGSMEGFLGCLAAVTIPWFSILQEWSDYF